MPFSEGVSDTNIMSEIRANFCVDIINIKRQVKGKLSLEVQIKVNYVRWTKYLISLYLISLQ